MPSLCLQNWQKIQRMLILMWVKTRTILQTVSIRTHASRLPISWDTVNLIECCNTVVMSECVYMYVIRWCMHGLQLEIQYYKVCTSNPLLFRTYLYCQFHTTNLSHPLSQPKLSLPYFSGDPLMWQISFNAAVHTSSNLTGIQKFSYTLCLRAQLKGDAVKAIAGFPLTDVIALLSWERLRQPYKLIYAHMQALLNLTNVNTLSSLQSFYDTMENHIRGLSSCGTSPESYGTLSYWL